MASSLPPARRSSVRARAAIITVPIGVLTSRAPRLTFKPPLPTAHLKAIAGLRMAHSRKSRFRSDAWCTRKASCTPGTISSARSSDVCALAPGRAVRDLLSVTRKPAVLSLSDKNATGHALGSYLKDRNRSGCLQSRISRNASSAATSRDGETIPSRRALIAARIGCADSRRHLADPVKGDCSLWAQAMDPRWAARVYGAYRSGQQAARLADEALERDPTPATRRAPSAARSRRQRSRRRAAPPPSAGRRWARGPARPWSRRRGGRGSTR